MDPTSSSRLPLELWLTIFKMLVQQYARQPRRPDRCLLRYARVNREWQAFFEKEHFQRLTVSPERMHQQLGNMVLRQRRLVRHVWFQIELTTYDHIPGDGIDNYMQNYMKRLDKDHEIVKKALHGIFSILENWSRRTDNDGLTLEIGLHSPSGSQTATPSLWSKMRLYDSVCIMESLPIVEVVQHLLVRRQTRRQLSVILWDNMVKALPNLEYLHQELWRVPSNITHSMSVFSRVLSTRCNSTQLKKLVAFGEYDPSLVYRRSKAPSEELIHCLAVRTCKLEQLCLSYVVDAFKFLIIAEGQPALYWPKLETLALTSRSLNIENEAGTRQMLETAAKLARKMPKLRTLELWDAGKSHAFAFTCRITPSAVEISYRATWEFKLPDSVERLWEDFAQERDQGHKVCVQKGQLINASEWKSHGDAIHALKLTADVIHPVSLMQIRREGEITSEN